MTSCFHMICTIIFQKLINPMRSMAAAADVKLPWSYFNKLFVFFFFLAAANLVLLQGTAKGSCVPIAEEASLLMEFKNAVLDSSHQLSSWQETNLSCSQINSSSSSSSSSSCSAWSGVICGRLHGRVTELLLPNMSLQGSIPASSLAQLRFLRHLDLSANNFSGGLPPQLANCTHLRTLDLSQNSLIGGSIPSEWGSLRNLRALSLWGDKLTGFIPATLGNCSALTMLILEINQLSKNIPQELGMLNRLWYLSLGDNNLMGAVPGTLGNCSALVELYLEVNALSGSIPPELGMLKTLRNLTIWGNQLTGGIPATLGNCTALTVLSLSVNQLSNNIPKELGMLNQVWFLGLDRNNLTGDVPATLANCSALLEVGLGTNELSGSIPSQLAMLKTLSSFSISYNKLTGNVQAEPFASWTALTFLDLSYNQLTGTLQVLTEMSNHSRLYALGLGANHFQGELPDVFDRFSGLQKLGLWHNSLTGTLPLSLASLKALTNVWMHDNMFHGRIPDVFVTSLQLQQLDLSSNNLSGAIPTSFGAFSGLLLLRLSHNSLSGVIPPELGSLFQLQNLTLSNNNLSGNIPSTLSNCVQLITLNLARNQLSGDLPATLGKLQSLAVLDLSYNEFTGLVPSIAPFNNTHVTNLTGNIGLCGEIVNRICDTNPPTNSPNASSDKPSNPKTKFIAIGVAMAVAVLGAMLVLAVFCYWNKPNIEDQALQLPTMLLAGTQLINIKATELLEATGYFREENVLGKGSVGTVYRAILPGGKSVAVKLLNNDMALTAEADFTREVNTLAKVRHKNILRVLGCCFNLDMKAIILELMPNGSLDKYIHGRFAQLSGEQKFKILHGVAQGLEYLHHHHPDGSIVHCDIKPENILLDADLEVHIADFGIAKVLKGSSFQESASILLRGSVGYIAPEYGYKPNPSTKGDVYSYGVVILEVLTSKRPTCNEIIEEGRTFLSWVRSAYPHNVHTILNAPSLSLNVASQLFHLAFLCTQDSPIDRPTMIDICRIFMDLHDHNL